MIIMTILSLLLSNAVTLRRDISILFNRIVIIALIYCILHDTMSLSIISKGVGLHGGLLHITNITQVFQIFIFLISILILQLTSFDPIKKLDIMRHLSFTIRWSTSIGKWSYDPAMAMLKDYLFKIQGFNKEHLKIIEYPLILLFVICGAVFLMSTNDLVSIFLSIELQSYGLYILSTIYRNSELSTTGGLIYFLLGGFSSCFILLGASLLYANSGTTSLDGLYIINSISDVNDNMTSWYKSYYLNFSLLIFSVGFLFKVSAAPFHFWSPERGLGKSSLPPSSTPISPGAAPGLGLGCMRGGTVGSKLPNSGNSLELQVPSYTRKGISGWTNHSCMVTSLKASEKNVGYRGSKSVVCNNITVKEQRVYGSWCGTNLPHLRCTLTGFERNYQVKIPSYQIIQRRLYSTESDFNQNIEKLPQLNEPWFISGFVDAEGCFLILIRKSPKNRLGWQLEANFTINLHVSPLQRSWRG